MNNKIRMNVSLAINLAEDKEKMFEVPAYWEVIPIDSRVRTRELQVGTKLSDYVILPLPFEYSIASAKKDNSEGYKKWRLLVNPDEAEGIKVAAWKGVNIYAQAVG